MVLRIILSLMIFGVCRGQDVIPNMAMGSVSSGTGYFYVGSYTGDGNYGRKITLPFNANFAEIKGAGATYAVRKTTTMGLDSAFQVGSKTALNDSLITIGTDSSMTVGNIAELNTNGVVYHYRVAREKAGEFKVFTYTGNQTAKNLVGLTGMKIALVWARGNKTDAYASDWLKTDSMASTITLSFGADAGTDCIGNLGNDTIPVTNGQYANQNGTVYHCFAVARVTGFIWVSSYIGNATDNRDISFTTATPDWVGIAGQNATQKLSTSSTETAGYYLNWTNLIESTIGTVIKQRNADGVKLGTSTSVNGASVNYFIWGMKIR